MECKCPHCGMNMDDRVQDEWNSYWEIDIDHFIMSCPHCSERVRVNVEFVRVFTATKDC